MDYLAPFEEIDDSKYPLPSGGSRIVHPTAVIDRMAAGELTKDLYPKAAGHYRSVRRHIVLPRVRPNPQLIYCISGCGTVEISGKESQVGAGDYVVLPANLVHSYASDANKPWTIVWIYFSGIKADHFCRLMKSGEVVHIGVRSELTSAAIAQLDWISRGYSEKEINRACAKLGLIFCEFAVAAEKLDYALKDRHIDKVSSWMLSCLSRPITLGEAAAVSGLSPFHFVRKFRTITGYSPIMYHTVLRMQRACEMLDASNEAVSSIADQVGYPDPQHFSRVFRRVMGVSPSGYRASNSHHFCEDLPAEEPLRS